MNKLVFVALLLAAACTKKGADCEPAITKGIDTMVANMKERAPNPQILERMMGVVDKVKSTMINRCKEDNWSPAALTCFSTAANQKEMQSCQSKLPEEQQNKLKAEITQAMMSAAGSGMRPGGMPAGMPPGHPETLAPNTAPAQPGDPAAAPGAAGAGAAAPAAGAAADGSGSGKTGW